MAKFINVTAPITTTKITINVDQVMYVIREHIKEQFNREMTKIVFRDNVFLYVEDDVDKLISRIN